MVRDLKRTYRLWTPVFVIVVLATLASFMVGQGSNSGTSVYLVRVGGTATYVGFLAVVFSVAAAVTRIVVGPIIDQSGRQKVLVAGGAVMLVGTLGPLLSNELIPFVAWRFLQGAGFSAATTALATAAADVLPQERLGEGIGYYGLGQAVSMSIGPALALFLANTNPPENLFIGLSCCAAAAMLLGLLVRYERNPLNLPATSEYRQRWERLHGMEGDAVRGEDELGGGSAAGEAVRLSEEQAGLENAADAGEGLVEARLSDALADELAASEGKRKHRFLSSILEPKALPGTIPMLAMSPAFGFGIFFVGLFGTTLGVGSAGMFYTISAVAMIAVRLGAGRFMDRTSAIKIFTVSVAAGLLAYAMLLAAGAWGAAAEWLYYAAGIPYGLSIGLAIPINQSVAVKNSPANRWGATNALFMLASDVGIGVSCLIWGMVNDAFGFGVTMVCVLGCILVAYGLAWLCYPEADKRWGHRG